MGKMLFLIFERLFKGFSKQALLGAGLGLASGLITLQVVNYYISKIQTSAGFLGSMAAILHLGGMDKAISIVIGACVVRAMLSSAKLSLVKARK